MLENEGEGEIAEAGCEGDVDRDRWRSDERIESAGVDALLLVGRRPLFIVLASSALWFNAPMIWLFSGGASVRFFRLEVKSRLGVAPGVVLMRDAIPVLLDDREPIPGRRYG